MTTHRRGSKLQRMVRTGRIILRTMEQRVGTVNQVKVQTGPDSPDRLVICLFPCSRVGREPEPFLLLIRPICHESAQNGLRGCPVLDVRSPAHTLAPPCEPSNWGSPVQRWHPSAGRSFLPYHVVTSLNE